MQTRVSGTEWEEWRRATGRSLEEFQSIKGQITVTEPEGPARAASGQHAAPPSDLTGEGANTG